MLILITRIKVGILTLTIRVTIIQTIHQEAVKYYYLVSPIIVKHIESMPNKTFIYQDIYENTIVPSLKAIKQGYYNLAHDIYKWCIKSQR